VGGAGLWRLLLKPKQQPPQTAFLPACQTERDV